ncbi:MAG: ABC transporter substrate-binding protein [Chloroflexi bacterium]|nr:ABC transporter substrate-binding protein [Chloroflexota bacterium]
MSMRPSYGRRTALRRTRLSRRALLRASARAGVGAAGLALVGCSDDEEPALQQQSNPPQDAQADPHQPQQQAVQQSMQQTDPEPDGRQEAQTEAPSGPARGGIVRASLPVERHDRWDPHRSRYRYTQAMHSLMYNRLIRPASVSTGELEADLCALPEIPDETTYVFRVDPAAVFWDHEPANGRGVTAEDIRWNIERQRSALDADGLPDPHFFRRGAYDRTTTAEATPDGSIRLSTAAPDAAYLGSVHASPYAWITNPEAAEQFGNAWRDNPSDVFLNSGTGPYTPLLYNGVELTLARSNNWWRADSAWADGVTLTSGDTNGIAGLYDAAALDRADFPLTNETVDALREQYPEHPTFDVPLAASVELIAPLSDEVGAALGDPRIVRAIGLAVDRPRLIQRLYGGQGRASGPLPWFLEGWALHERLMSGLPGYREDREADLAEVAALVSGAGGATGTPIPLVAADLFEGFFPGSGEAVRGMIGEATGIDVELEHRPFAEAIDQLRAGERFCFLGWGPVPQQADPTDTWSKTLHSQGSRRWSGGGSPELDALIERMRTTFNLGARQDLAHQVQEMLLRGEAVHWQMPLINGVQLGLHQPWLHPDLRLFEYAWSTDRLSTSWLDTTHESYPVERELPSLEGEGEADE